MRGMREFQYDNPGAYFTYLLFFMRIKKFRDLYADQALRSLRNLAKKWNAVQGWKEALNRFALVWEARFPHQCA